METLERELMRGILALVFLGSLASSVMGVFWLIRTFLF
jgi:hypothetical protein